MHYFAYGSNTHLPHFRDFVASHGVDTEEIGVHQLAILRDHEIRTNYLSNGHGAGACNIEPSEGGVVEGLLMEISPAIREVLRIKEGWPHRYEEIRVQVLVGDRRKPVRALTYIVAADHRLNADMPVTPRYRRIVLEGAEAAGLSESYQEHLRILLRTTDSFLKDIAGEGRAALQRTALSSPGSP